VWTARAPRPVGLLMGVAGLAFIALGWLVGTQGFTSAGALPTQVGYLTFFALAIWLLIAAWWRRTSVKPAVAESISS
jgi:hypothetical protein